MNVLLYFWIFLKSSLLSFGGLSNLPYLHNDLMALQWAEESDFISAIAVGQLSPRTHRSVVNQFGLSHSGLVGWRTLLAGSQYSSVSDPPDHFVLPAD